MRALWEGLPPTHRGGYAETAGELVGRVAETVRPGDVVMVKGSNGSKAGDIVAGLTAAFELEQAGEGAAR